MSGLHPRRHRAPSAASRSARRCCASRPRAPRPSAWPRWSAACSCWWTPRSRTARSHDDPARPRGPRAGRAGGRRRPRSTSATRTSGWSLRASSSGVARPPPRRGSTFGEGFAGRVAARQRAAALLQDPATERAAPTRRCAELELESLIGVPLLAGGRSPGCSWSCAGAPRRFTAEDLGLLRLAADRVALGIDHARVYEREHRIAETLQRSLLPERLPQLPGPRGGRPLPARPRPRPRWAATGTT